MDGKQTVSLEAFSRIAPACPVIADSITVNNLFESLTSYCGGRLHFLIYDKYIKYLDKYGISFSKFLRDTNIYHHIFICIK